jgi:hypothetical protein
MTLSFFTKGLALWELIRIDRKRSCCNISRHEIGVRQLVTAASDSQGKRVATVRAKRYRLGSRHPSRIDQKLIAPATSLDRLDQWASSPRQRIRDWLGSRQQIEPRLQ